jgi:hypothetical protein
MSTPYPESVVRPARIGCELLIVLFKINEHTHTMANRP